MGFVLKGDRETGTITYHCSTTKRAVDKLEDFQREQYLNIQIVKDDRVLSVSRLLRLVEIEKLVAA